MVFLGHRRTGSKLKSNDSEELKATSSKVIDKTDYIIIIIMAKQAACSLEYNNNDCSMSQTCEFHCCDLMNIKETMHCC